MTLHAEIIDSVEEGSIICTDGWAAYEGIIPGQGNQYPGLRNAQQLLMYRDHLTVIHDRQFVEPPRNEPPFWRNDILPECRDKQFIGPLPQLLEVGTWLPFRVHTQHAERQWIELRNSVNSSSDLASVDRSIGIKFIRDLNQVVNMQLSELNNCRLLVV